MDFTPDSCSIILTRPEVGEQKFYLFSTTFLLGGTEGTDRTSRKKEFPEGLSIYIYKGETIYKRTTISKANSKGKFYIDNKGSGGKAG